ncbi:hypothetical protein ABBQ38_000271 [Trebouxia sp. C0009 RCD-2024]
MANGCVRISKLSRQLAVLRHNARTGHSIHTSHTCYQPLFTRQVSAQPLTSHDDNPVEDLKNETAPDHRQKPTFRLPDFSNFQEAHKPKSNLELIRAYGIFTVCQIRPIVQHADTLLDFTKKVLGSTITYGLVRKTFFGHFCAGEDQAGIKPKINMLHQNGIGGILDYAAEDDMDDDEGAGGSSGARESGPKEKVVARTFDYGSEAICDGHMETFMKSIEAAGDAPGRGFAAIKITALGNPKLLERVAAGLMAIRNMFSQFDEDMNNVITREEFIKVYREMFTDATPERTERMFHYLDPDNTGYIDYLGWSQTIKLQDIPSIIKTCKAPGPLYLSSLSDEELQLLDNMMNRLYKIADVAAKLKVRLMVDAEHTYFQPAIDHATVELQRRFNKEEAVVLNTYQCYLKDSWHRLQLDMERSRREGFKFGAKLVRGAYMYLERERARELKFDSPIWDSLEETHANYNRCADELVKMSRDEDAEVMIATHNQKSIERAVSLMHELEVQPQKSGVYFGQLLGMADHLTFILGRNGFRAYKYVPFGPVAEVLPYLIRRAQENSDIMAGVSREKGMILAEIWRRLKESTGLGKVMPSSEQAASARQEERTAAQVN